jgi:multicomponent Na+:H+ antiporter subunit G
MIEILSGIFLILGSFFMLLSAVGILRMPDIYTRMSATTKASTLGIGLVLIGTALFWGSVSIVIRSLAIIFFLLLTAPVAAHIIGRAAYFGKIPLWYKTQVDELKGKYDEETHQLK